jgi:hypothetical protein
VGGAGEWEWEWGNHETHETHERKAGKNDYGYFLSTGFEDLFLIHEIVLEKYSNIPFLY